MKLALALLLAITAAAPAAKFDGTWTLDAASSTNLPPHVQSAREWRLDVAGDATALGVKVNILPADGEAVTADFRYRVDGQASPVTLPVRTPSGPKRIDGVANAKIEDGAFVLAVTSERPTPNGPVTVTSEERWTVDGDVLTVARKDPSPNGPVSYTMVFKRAPLTR